MPYPNFHAARVKDPGLFARIVVLKTLSNGIMIYGGPLKTNPGGASTAQSYRFPVSKFTSQQARSWLSEHDIKIILFEPASTAASRNEPNRNYGLAYEGADALVVSSEFADGDMPVQRFKKDMIRVGEYVHPVHKWSMDVTPERLYRWLGAYKKMRENGVDVEIVKDHSDSADDIVGYVIDMMVEENSEDKLALFGIHEMRGEAAIHLAGICKNVSVYIDKDYIDGERRSYGEAIVHSSLCQQPVVPGQDAFIPIAASAAGGSKVPIMTLKFSQEKEKMDEKLLKQIQELLGADESLTEDTLLDRLTKKLSSLNDKIEEATKQNTKLTGEIESLKASAANKDGEVKIDPNLAEQMGTTAKEQLSLLVKAGKITPACEKLLASSLIGETGSRNVRMLSIGGKDKPSVFSGIITALKENDIVKLGEQTGAQVTLSRVTPGSDDEKDDFDQETQDTMKKQAGIEKKT